MIAKPLLLYLKYYLLYLRRELMYRPIKVKQDMFESNKSSIIICGNGPSYNIFENEYINNPKKYTDYDVLMLNFGAFYSKLKINYHIFEPPKDKFELDRFVKLLEGSNNSDYKIFRPNSYTSYQRIKELNLKDLFIISEKRIRFLNKDIMYSDLNKIKSDSILFCRASMIYATLFAIKLGYNQIKYVGIDPHTTASFYSPVIDSGSHLTLMKYSNLSVYDLLNIIANFSLFNNIRFSIQKESSLDFLSKDYNNNTNAE